MKRTTPNYDQRDIDAGSAAQELLGGEAFQTALVRTKNSITSSWIQADDMQKREELHAQIVALELIVGHLMAAVGDGKQAQHLKAREEKADGERTSTEGE